jgi:hypothetical protein
MSTRISRGLVEHILRTIDLNERAMSLPTWKQVTLGLRSREQYVAALAKKGVQVLGPDCRAMLSRIGLARKRIRVPIVVLASDELIPLGGNYPLREVVQRAVSGAGLSVLPSELGPALRLAYENQPPGECLIIPVRRLTIEDLAYSGNGLPYPGMFCVGRHANGEKYLFGAYSDRMPPYGTRFRYVFGAHR